MLPDSSHQLSTMGTYFTTDSCYSHFTVHTKGYLPSQQAKPAANPSSVITSVRGNWFFYLVTTCKIKQSCRF